MAEEGLAARREGGWAGVGGVAMGGAVMPAECTRGGMGGNTCGVGVGGSTDITVAETAGEEHDETKAEG